ncbi:MAG: phosphoenolpyruvate-utilizing N-terminal domain-containing protein, partial [Gammaproteobacteria bacterium]
FEAFLGVPLVHFGNVTGVLVVQDRRRRPFTANEETLLITVASQLAGSLLRWPEPERRRGTRTLATRRIQGIKGAPGVGIGRLHLIGGDALVQAVESPAPVDTPTESARLNDAVMMLNTELAAARQRLEGAVTHDVLAILDFYKLMLESDELIAAAQRRIHTGMSAFAAVRITVDECVLAFESMSDEYLRARGEDVRHIGTRLMSAMLGRSAQLPDDATDVVLVGDAIAVTDIARFGPGQLAGIVSLRGSTLSHTAVLANARGIPAVMAVGALDHLVEGERAIVDGSLGLLFLNPTGSLVREYRRILDQAQALNRELLANKDLPASTTDGFRVRLLANTGLLADAAPGLANGAEGIGLYRSEIPFLAHATFPTEDEQYEIYREILALYHPHPVTMRTLDVGGDKTLPYMTFDEENPSLGWRGIRFRAAPARRRRSRSRTTAIPETRGPRS